VKHIADLLNTANLLANQNKFANEIVPEVTVTLEYGVLGKLDLCSQKPETLIENTNENKKSAHNLSSKTTNHFSTLGKSNISFSFKIPTRS
jgi:hypothetical protein